MQAMKHACQEIHAGFETESTCHQKSKTGVSVAPQKELMSSKIFLERASFFFHLILKFTSGLFTRTVELPVKVSLEAYSLCQIRILIPIPNLTANQMATLHCVELFTQYGVSFRFPSQLPTTGMKMGSESELGSVNVNKSEWV